MDKVEVIGLRVCSWCKDVMGFRQFEVPAVEVGKTTPITHGICEECSEKFDKEMEEEMTA